MDQDDKLVTEVEKILWYDTFSLFDSLGDGTIKNDDLGTVMRSLGCLFTNEELKKIIEDVDTDGNGTVDFDEFTNIMIKYPPTLGSEEELADAISIIGADCGNISLKKLRRNLTNLGETLTDEEFDILNNMYIRCGEDGVDIKSLSRVIVNGKQD